MATESIAVRNSAADRKAGDHPRPLTLDADAERTIAEQRAKIAELEERVEKLRAALHDTDAVAGETLTEISALARIAMGWMENPSCYEQPRILFGVLHAIWSRTETLDDNINSYAEAECCGRVLDEQEIRVGRAASAARRQQTTGQVPHG